MGAERKRFFLALTMGAAIFNLMHMFLGGISMLGVLHTFARWARISPRNAEAVRELLPRCAQTAIVIRTDGPEQLDNRL
jgi:hypothetical protein